MRPERAPVEMPAITMEEVERQLLGGNLGKRPVKTVYQRYCGR